MRLEDWQKWLETQFIDSASQAGAAVEEQPNTTAAPSTPEQIADAVVSHAPAPEPIAARDTQTEPIAARETQAEPAPAHVAPAPQPPRHTASGLVEEVEMPSIERYLPFLRSAEPPPPQTAPSPEPAVEAPVADPGTEPDAPPQSDPPEPESQAPHATDSPSSVPQRAEPPAQDVAASPRAAVEIPATADENEMGSSPDSGPHRFVRRPAAVHQRTRPPVHADPNAVAENLAAGGLWDLVPRHIHTLVAMGSDEVAKNSYKREFKESRIELIGRLLDPTLSLEETARLLNVCPTTIRRYTNRGLLTHQRTPGDQRRFKLSDVLAFLESQSRPDSRKTA